MRMAACKRKTCAPWKPGQLASQWKHAAHEQGLHFSLSTSGGDASSGEDCALKVTVVVVIVGRTARSGWQAQCGRQRPKIKSRVSAMSVQVLLGLYRTNPLASSTRHPGTVGGTPSTSRTRYGRWDTKHSTHQVRSVGHQAQHAPGMVGGTPSTAHVMRVPPVAPSADRPE
eukprot:scaffold237506_cov23-Tisochrysis_lutea.AAC.1